MANIIAEIGCNHKGSIEIAKELILLAKESGAHVAKFQKRNPKELLSSEQYNSPHPNPVHSYGDSYGVHRELLEFSIDQHKVLKEFCEEIGIIYSSSVWDVTSASEMITLNPPLIKVGSPSNLHFEMQKLLRDDYSGEIHISTGMTTPEEIEQIVCFWEKKDQAKRRVVLYSCTSGYPVPFEDVCLLEISSLREKYGGRVKGIGFSGHHLGIAIDVAAYALGVSWIERHFTKDRTWKGTDHAASLEPEGLRKLCRDIRSVSMALTLKSAGIIPIEEPQRSKLKFT